MTGQVALVYFNVRAQVIFRAGTPLNRFYWGLAFLERVLAASFLVSIAAYVFVNTQLAEAGIGSPGCSLSGKGIVPFEAVCSGFEGAGLISTVANLWMVPLGLTIGGFFSALFGPAPDFAFRVLFFFLGVLGFCLLALILVGIPMLVSDLFRLIRKAVRP